MVDRKDLPLIRLTVRDESPAQPMGIIEQRMIVEFGKRVANRRDMVQLQMKTRKKGNQKPVPMALSGDQFRLLKISKKNGGSAPVLFTT
jgi:hypothetical protein